MWYLKNIPKIVHFYWSGKKCSFLQFMSVYTFWQLNPDWEIQLHVCRHNGKDITWKSKEQEYLDNYDDYSEKLYEIPVKTFYHDFTEYGLSNSLTDVHKSDILRHKLLADFGGLYSDMDILFLKPMDALECNKIENESKDTFVSIFTYGHSIGFLMSRVNNPYYGALYYKAKARAKDEISEYQEVGAPMINETFDKITKIPGNVYNFTMDTVYPYNATQIAKMFQTNDCTHVNDNTIGIHWYAGHPLAGEYLNKTNGGLRDLPECVITTYLKNYAYVDRCVPITSKYTSNKIFLFGISGVGKTTFAKNYAQAYQLQYIDFDLHFGIVNHGWTSRNTNASKEFLAMLPERFITEFVPIAFVPIAIGNLSSEERYADFIEYAQNNDVQIVAMDCSDKVQHDARLAQKNMSLLNLEPNTEVIEFFKSKGLKVDYYDTSGI